MNYSLITHLEKSEEEIDPLLKILNLSGKIHIAGQFNWEDNRRVQTKVERAPDELHWKNVPRETAKLIYKHFFLDFVLFGYSSEDVLR